MTRVPMPCGGDDWRSHRATLQGSLADPAQDPDRKGVAVIIDVETVRGVGADGPFLLGASPASGAERHDGE
jgi:hypothetical protein